MSQFICEKIAIIGVGLIGGSFARALKDSMSVKEIIGFDTDSKNLDVALELKIIDRKGSSLKDTVSNSDVVFIAAPVSVIPLIAEDIAPYLAPGCIVTDGGSVKAEIVEKCEDVIPDGCFFVGGHPIAGTEFSGAAASFSTLYSAKRCILTPTENTDENALEVVSQLWSKTGAIVCMMDAKRHDRIFAEISHLPHIIAYALVHAVGASDSEGENVLSFSAGGFKDFTRIASSDPVMWRDIAIMNKKALLNSIDSFSSTLNKLRTAIADEDGKALEAMFRTSKSLRDQIL